jgi:hypothetical protein
VFGLLGNLDRGNPQKKLPKKSKKKKKRWRGGAPPESERFFVSKFCVEGREGKKPPQLVKAYREADLA